MDSITAGAGALKAGHHYDFAFAEAAADPLGANFKNAGSAMGGFRGDAHLRPRHRDGSDAFAMESHCEQSAGHLLTAGQQHVHFPLGGGGIEGVRQSSQFIGGVTHGGHHHHHVVPVFATTGNPPSHSLNALNTANGGAAKFLHQQGHFSGL